MAARRHRRDHHFGSLDAEERQTQAGLVALPTDSAPPAISPYTGALSGEEGLGPLPDRFPAVGLAAALPNQAAAVLDPHPTAGPAASSAFPSGHHYPAAPSPGGLPPMPAHLSAALGDSTADSLEFAELRLRYLGDGGAGAPELVPPSEPPRRRLRRRGAILPDELPELQQLADSSGFMSDLGAVSSRTEGAPEGLLTAAVNGASPRESRYPRPVRWCGVSRTAHGHILKSGRKTRGDREWVWQPDGEICDAPLAGAIPIVRGQGRVGRERQRWHPGYVFRDLSDRILGRRLENPPSALGRSPCWDLNPPLRLDGCAPEHGELIAPSSLNVPGLVAHHLPSAKEEDPPPLAPESVFIDDLGDGIDVDEEEMRRLYEIYAIPEGSREGDDDSSSRASSAAAATAGRAALASNMDQRRRRNGFSEAEALAPEDLTAPDFATQLPPNLARVLASQPASAPPLPHPRQRSAEEAEVDWRAELLAKDPRFAEEGTRSIGPRRGLPKECR